VSDGEMEKPKVIVEYRDKKKFLGEGG